jgi:UbiD family decarboxylase
LQYALAEKGKHPVILCERPIKADGEISQFPLVVNLTASRELCCKLLGISDPRRAAIDYAQRLSQKGKVRVVSKSEAPVKEVIERGAEVNLFRFPHTIQHEMNVGIYITAGFVTTYDPDTGIDNTALQRCWVKARNRTGLVPSPTTHNLNNIQKFMARKEDTPVAVWIGHHPAGIMGGQSKLGYPVSHYPSMAGALGEELRLVPTETFGEKILVPANAEIVIEGYVPCGVFEAEGPFAEYTGYVGPQIPAPVIEVACVTYRRNAIYQDYALGLPDMLVLDNMAMGLRHKSGVNHWARDSQ